MHHQPFWPDNEELEPKEPKIPSPKSTSKLRGKPRGLVIKSLTIDQPTFTILVEREKL